MASFNAYEYAGCAMAHFIIIFTYYALCVLASRARYIVYFIRSQI